MYEVKRAIIMAAGLGNRMQPITKTVPKPLVPVKGKPMIETIIEALQENGIWEIHIVVGYLKEQFGYLLEQYEGVTLHDNPRYMEHNNISSLYVVRDYLENVMILDGDQVVQDASALIPFFQRSGYNAVWVEKPTSEWLMQVEDGIVTSCSRTGGDRGWQLYSISRWNEEDGRRLRKHLIEEYEEKRRYDLYWDDVAMFCHPKEYELGIHRMQEGAVIEIDSVEELEALEASI